MRWDITTKVLFIFTNGFMEWNGLLQESLEYLFSTTTVLTGGRQKKGDRMVKRFLYMHIRIFTFYVSRLYMIIFALVDSASSSRMP